MNIHTIKAVIVQTVTRMALLHLRKRYSMDSNLKLQWLGRIVLSSSIISSKDCYPLCQ